MEIQVTDPAEIAAVKSGEIEGSVYKDDGQVWADEASLEAWRTEQQRASDEGMPEAE